MYAENHVLAKKCLQMVLLWVFHYESDFKKMALERKHTDSQV